jgi:hypothetical protein
MLGVLRHEGVKPMSAESASSDGDVDGTARQRDDEAEARGAALAVREAQVEARETSRAERLEDARVIRANADQRDQCADGRDWDAGERDEAARVESLLRGDDEDGRRLAGRDAAGRDRKDARADRVSAAVDRALLSEDDDPRDGAAT